MRSAIGNAMVACRLRTSNASMSNPFRYEIRRLHCKLCMKSTAPSRYFLCLFTFFSPARKKMPKSNSRLIKKGGEEKNMNFAFMKVQQNFPRFVLCYTSFSYTFFTCVIINSKRNIKHPWLFFISALLLLAAFFRFFVNGKFIFMAHFRRERKNCSSSLFLVLITNFSPTADAIWRIKCLDGRREASWSVTQFSFLRLIGLFMKLWLADCARKVRLVGPGKIPSEDDPIRASS